MSFLLMTLAFTAPPDPPSDWKFVDEMTLGGRSAATFRTVELSDVPTRPLHSEDKPPAGAKHGSVGLGPGGRQRLGIVWHVATNTLWFNVDGDGRFRAAERHTLTDKPLEVKVTIDFGDDGKQTRTVLIRKRGEGVAWCVRGYTRGTVLLNGKRVGAILTDGDADGCFDGVGADRVWLDLDGDGKFDPLTEQFPLGTAIPASGTSLLVRPHSDGLGIQVRERPSENGTIRVDVSRLPKADVVELTANYVSEFGELVVVKAADRSISLPAGAYRVDSVQLALLDVDGRVWRYSFFASRRSLDVEIEKGKETVHRLLERVKVTVDFNVGDGIPAGESVLVHADVTASGLYLAKCEVTSKFAEYGREVCAEIKLTEPGSVVLDRCESGFH
jgi:hypothetical protein